MLMLNVYFVYNLLLFVHSFHYSCIHLGTDVIVQVIIGEPLRALMLFCRGNLSDTDVIVYICCSNILEQ